MIKLKLNLDYKLNPPDGKKVTDKDNAEVSKGYIEYAVSAFHREGLDSQFRRVYAKIQQKIDSAIEDEKYEIDLDQGEFNLIKLAFDSDKVKFQASLAKYVLVLEDEILSK